MSAPARPIILYVDDEATALKYFSRCFADEYVVLTATNAEAGLVLLREHQDKVAVVVADQRMPQVSGAEFLALCRHECPDTTRILTTAYSDLDAAIAAVNHGAIYHYALKPWDLDELRITLRHAADRHAMQAERRMLLEERMQTLQRFVINDRIRSLIVLTKGLASRIRNPVTALKTFLDCAPFRSSPEFANHSVEWQELLGMAREISADTLRIIEGAVDTASQVTADFSILDLPELLDAAIERRRQAFTVMEVARPERMRGDARLLKRMFQTLINRLWLIDPEQPLGLTATEVEHDDRAFVCVSLYAPGATWSQAEFDRCYGPCSALRPSEQQADLLCAYFIVYHHSGELQPRIDGEQGPGFEVLLPVEPEGQTPVGEDAGWGDYIFTHYPALVQGV